MFSSSSRLRGFFSTISRKVASLNTIKAGTFCLPASHLRRAYRAFSSFSSASLSGAAPAVDLVRIYRNAGFPVICTSAETGGGVEELRTLIRGKLVAFTGNSGVGKSSILNRLAPELKLSTGEVSEKLGRGRHTTRHVELYSLGDDTFVMDTPGFSSFDTDEMDVILKENLQYAFADFGAYLGKCRFDDCTHRREPGCAVREACGEGKIEKTRYESYLKLYEKASQIKTWELK